LTYFYIIFYFLHFFFILSHFVTVLSTFMKVRLVVFYFLGLELGWLGWGVLCVGWSVGGLTRAKPGNCTSIHIML
jgi:hypothetical protein